jgi:hypothetical protein
MGRALKCEAVIVCGPPCAVPTAVTPDGNGEASDGLRGLAFKLW